MMHEPASLSHTLSLFLIAPSPMTYLRTLLLYFTSIND